MAALVLYPVAVVQVPGLGDYLNHLARMHILADIDRSEALRGFYRVHWQAIPYLAMDASFVVLSRIAPIYDAGRIFVAVCIVLPVLSVALLHFAVHRRLSLVPVAMFLFCYNYLLSWGFVHYLLALCLAVMLFAGWVASAGWRRWPRAALFCGLALALYLSHLVAFGGYCLAVGGYELARAWRSGFRCWRAVAIDWLAAGAQAVPAIVVALSVDLGQPFVGALRTSYGDLPTKLVALESPVLFFGGHADLLAGGCAVLVLVLGLWTRRLRLAPAVWPAALAVAAAAACMPNWLLGTFGMDFRLPLLAVMLLIGATGPTERMGRVLATAILGGFFALTAVRATGISTALRTVDAQIAQIREVVGAMPHGKRLLIVETGLDGPSRRAGPWRATAQSGMVAVIDRDAFVPFLFSGLSTVHMAPAMQAASTPNGHPLRLSDLTEGLGRKDDTAGARGDGEGRRVYWWGWETKFDYVLIEHFGSPPAALPANLRPVATSPVADLYRIERTVIP
jgi:hypothetical protein